MASIDSNKNDFNSHLKTSTDELTQKAANLSSLPPELRNIVEREVAKQLRMDIEIEQLKAKNKADQTKLEAEMTANQRIADHEHAMEFRQNEKEVIGMVIQAVASVLNGSIDVYERVQKTKLAAVESRYRMILELAKVDKDLAKTFIANEGSEVAAAAGEEGAKALMSGLAGVLARGATH